MTSDPSVNYWLRKFSEPTPNKMVSVVRSVMLFRLLSFGCRDIRSDKGVLDNYVGNSGFFALSNEAAKDASRLGHALFNGFDYESLAHLCAGADYLFGPQGALVKNAMGKGSGELVT